MNEILILGAIFLNYTLVLLSFRLFKKDGLIMWTIIATITANIEVMILIKAFGIEQTLGNVLFASSFLVTDILSEVYGKKEANKAVWIGTCTSLIFIILSQYWLLYIPSTQDWAMSSMETIFSNTPRIMLAGIVAYVISQLFDVWLYHKWWALTTKKTGDSKPFLWLRNNGSTLISQLLNVLLFTGLAFGGTFPPETVFSIFLSSYLIYVVTSIADTPFVYFARRMAKRQG